MSTLTKKLHILKSGGTEETCNIYTTPEEVGGRPYLALEVDGQEGYVKLGSIHNANATNLIVTKNDITYAAWKQATDAEPTGSVSVGDGDIFSVPPGVKVIKVFWSKGEHDDISHSAYTYVGVTPGKKYKLQCYTCIIKSEEVLENETFDGIYLGSKSGHELATWFQCIPLNYIQNGPPRRGFELSWSPEINKMKPTYTDY